MALPPVGLQLIIFGGKYDINSDTDIILDAVANSGYAAVEGGAKDAAQYRRMLDARGLVYGGSHVLLSSLSNTASLIEYLKIVGGSDICNSGLQTWGEHTADDYYQAIPILNKAGSEFKKAGIHFHYHHHEFEFKKMDGNKTGMDILLEGLDPDVIDFCFDVAWIQKGGANPADYIEQHKDWVSYLHFKDYDDAGWTELGRGVVDFDSIMKLLPKLPNIRWVMIEQDKTNKEPAESIAISRSFLRDTYGY